MEGMREGGKEGMREGGKERHQLPSVLTDERWKERETSIAVSFN